MAAKKSQTKTRVIKAKSKNPSCATNNRTNTQKKAREQAGFEGLQPHEWLAKVASGQMITQRRLVIEYFKIGNKKGLEKGRAWVEEEYYPTFEERKDAAKAAAPYFAPRLAVQQTNLTPGLGNKSVSEIMKDVAEKLPN